MMAVNFQNLPGDVVLNILRYCGISDMLAVSQVCLNHLSLLQSDFVYPTPSDMQTSALPCFHETCLVGATLTCSLVPRPMARNSSSVLNRQTHWFGKENGTRPSNMVALASLRTSHCPPGSLPSPNISWSWRPRVGKRTQAAIGRPTRPFQQPTHVGMLECKGRQAHMNA